MRRILLAAILLVGAASFADDKPPVLRGAATSATKVVLLELYTSQG